MTYPRLSWSIRRFARLLPAVLALAVCLNYCPNHLQAADTPPKEAAAPAAPAAPATPAPAAVAPATTAPPAEKSEPAAAAAPAP
ncbi:MAG: hypothetical protein NTW80_06560, partial [Deltaproteobacteria bacterium]|nr:hypothetical protein [Deltaproteobacteria bacterium]